MQVAISEFEDLYVFVFSPFWCIWQHFDVCLGLFLSILCSYRSMGPPGGNQVDGLPPALRRVLVFAGDIFRLLLDVVTRFMPSLSF